MFQLTGECPEVVPLQLSCLLEDLHPPIALVYLPSYSPDDTHKGREAFSKIKNLLRKAQARTREALVEAIGKAIPSISARDARVSSSTADTVLRFNFLIGTVECSP